MYYANKKTSSHISSDLNLILNRINEAIKKDKYIVQLGVDGAKYKGSFFIIRSIVVNDIDSWDVYLKAVVAKDNSEVSNTSQGSANYFCETVLEKIFPDTVSQCINKIKYISSCYANYFESFFKDQVLELAFDFMYDLNGGLRIIEINTVPGMFKPGMPKNPFKDIFNMSLQEKIIFDKYVTPHVQCLANFVENKVNNMSTSRKKNE